MNGVIHPMAWLWYQLECLLTPLQIAELRAGYKLQSDCYNRASKIRQVKRDIATFEKCISCGSRVDHYQRRIERRKARLAQLEAADVK